MPQHNGRSRSKKKLDLKLPGWSVGEPFNATTKVSGQTIYVTGIEATHPVLGPVVGSAGSVATYPFAQAWFELIERTAILENLHRSEFDCLDAAKGRFVKKMPGIEVFPQAVTTGSALTYQFAKSNGVALHDSWREACKRACFELIERHLVLKSWIGESTPKVLAQDVLGLSFQKIQSLYSVIPLDFGGQAVTCFRNLIQVAGVTLVPKDTAHPLILSYGAGFSKKDALQKAKSESWQRLGFLFGEEIPSEEPAFLASPLYHQDYYLYPAHHQILHRWFKGEFATPNPKSSTIMRVDFAAMSSPSRPEYFVSKAIAQESIPLVFGNWDQGPFAKIPDERKIHPIP